MSAASICAATTETSSGRERSVYNSATRSETRRQSISGAQRNDTAGAVSRLHGQAQQSLSRGRLDEARRALTRILDLEPVHADAQFLLGIVELQQGRPAAALDLIDRAIALAPGKPEYLAQAARCLALAHRNDEAIARVGQALALPVAAPAVLDTLGVVCARAGDHARAAELFARALALPGVRAESAFNLGAARQFLGDFAAAEAAFEQALALDPAFFRAHPAIAALRRQSAGHNHIERLEQALAAAGADPDACLLVRQALAKELEDLGRDAEAFAHLRAGRAGKRQALNYAFEEDAAIFAAVRDSLAGLSRQSIAPGVPPGGPIFVVGMPRTGTTLVERILSAHPDVGTVGESPAFGVALKRLAGTGSAAVLDAATIRAGLAVPAAELRRAYLGSVAAQAGGAGRFTDKFPLNFMYLGFIRRALPDARVIWLRRGALDTCLSNFRQLFATGFRYYRYALDIEDTARYYVELERLLPLCRGAVGGHLLELGYEALVREPERRIRELLDFCGLPFDPACLRFHDNALPVATASAVQVREPLHGESIGRWRRYRAELEPAIAILEAASIPLE